MAIEGFRAGWRAGVQDANSTVRAATRDVRSGNARSVVENAREGAGNFIDGAVNVFQKVGEGVVHFGGAIVGAVIPAVGKAAARTENEIRATRYEGQAQSSLQKAGSSFKKAWTAASRSYKDSNIKGFGANLAFSVGSWGGNMKESMKNLGCAIKDGFKALGNWFKTQI